VYLGFGFGDQGKNSQGPLLCPGAYSGLLYQFSDILPGMVVMSAFMGMSVMVMMAVIMMIIVRVGVIVLSDGPAFRIDNRVDAAYAAAILPDKVQCPALKPKFGEFGPQQAGIDSQVYKGTQYHIAGNTGKAIKM
jgi:hypothetical protein